MSKQTLTLFFLSLLIVGWGQPQSSLFLSLFASAFGFALFWFSLFGIQKRFTYSALWFSLVQFVQLSWLASPTYQGFYIYLVYAALALCLGLEFGVLSLFFPKEKSLTVKKCLGIAALWTLMEWSRLYFLCGFAWNPIGLSMTAHPFSSQLAALGGVFGLSFWVMFVNLLAVKTFVEWKKSNLCYWSGAILTPYLFGFFHIYYHDAQNRERSEPFHVALVQTSLFPDQKTYFHERKEHFISPYTQWTSIIKYLEHHHSKELDLIVLPEAALPFSAYSAVYELEEVRNIVERIWGEKELDSLLVKPFSQRREGKTYVNNAFWAQLVANHYGAELVIGLDDFDDEHSYNAAFHFVPNQHAISRYEKRVLLPLAEYLPFSFLKPLVARYGITHFFTKGKEAKVIEGKRPFSISICYEECFSHLVREGRQKGAKLLVNVTNDGWYPFSKLPQQHFDHGRVRAIENGVPLVRACNTGVTAGVDSLGRTIGRFGSCEGSFELERGALYLSVDPYSHKTLYTFWGDAFILAFSLLCLIFLVRSRKTPH